MESGNNYRLLQLQKLLFNETDRKNSLGMNEIKEKLQQASEGVAFDHRTIKNDMDVLGKFDFEVVRNKGKYGKNLYSHQARLFEVYELRLMIDAILSARFITKNEKQQLISKIKKLTSKHIAKTLPGPVLISQSANIDYERVKLNIDYVHRAISEEKVLTYQYGRFNLKKHFEFSRDGDFYYVEPYALTWQNDYYYLIGMFQETKEMRHYRLDRIRNISISDHSFKKQDFQIEEYVNQSFHMFAGKEIRFHIRFHNDLINVVFDRFGLQANIKEVDEEHFVLTAKAKLSRGLINWILTWGNKAKVLSPEYLVKEVKSEVAKMYDVYN